MSHSGKFPPGHEDLDQIFSVISSLIARYEFSTPEDLIEILDFAGQPLEAGEQERKRVKKPFTVECQAYKLDQTAKWHDWVSPAAVKVKGLSFSEKINQPFCYLYHKMQGFAVSSVCFEFCNLKFSW